MGGTSTHPEKHKKDRRTGRSGATHDADEEVHNKVQSLKRKHQQDALLAGEDPTGHLFWSKKVERDIKTGSGSTFVDSHELSREREAELERVRARRAQNEAEFAQRQEDVGELERLRLAAEAVKEAAKEEQFHLIQSIGRARKRLDEQRPHEIDLLVRALHLQRSHPVEDKEWRPYDVFVGLRVGELRELLQEVGLFKDIDVEQEGHAAYWQALSDLMQQQIGVEVQAEQDDRQRVQAGSGQAPVHSAVEEIVSEALRGTLEELQELEAQVEMELQEAGCPDPQFWEAVRPKIARRKAECVVESIFLAKAAQAAAEVEADGIAPPSAAPPEEASAVAGPGPEGEGEEEDDEDEGPPEWLLQSDGRFSPPLEHEGAAEDVAIIDEEDDRELLQLARKEAQQEAERRGGPILTAVGAGPRERPAAAAAAAPDLPSASVASGSSGGAGGIGDANDIAALRHARATMGISPDELEFRALVPLESQEYWWKEKYKPRRPKFFNKVHTGYDWNKYNRAHYDVDNPPPKVVQGYKFNIFYPDLIDKLKAPTYRVVRDPSGDDATCLLMFTAGAPYEDVAFRIVNKDWDRGPKKGFRNVFDRGMLQLYFNFKRTPYRR